MSAWLDPAPWSMVLAGWSVIVALWHTSVVAVGLATWRLWRRDATARTQYAAVSGALALSVVLTLATPALLMIRSATPPPPIMAMVGAPAQAASGPPSTIPRQVLWRATLPGLASVAVPWIGVAWCLGFALALVRLGGGWGMAQWIRRRASAVQSPVVARAAAAASETWDLPPAPLLASAHVEAPVVIGARSPAVLLPVDLEHRLHPDVLPPLIAHELAHVDRRDYAANLLQSVADALLFFSPGARWVSRRVREAREYCCDDIVAARCGTGAYVSALTALARLGVAARARPAVSAAGPRLIVRIRRLLQEDAMTPSARYRLAGLAGLLVLSALAGTGVVPLSATALSGTTAALRSAAPALQPAVDIPMGFVHTQPGAALRLRSMRSAAALCGVADVENLAEVAITGLRFAAFVHAQGPAPAGERSNLGSGTYATSELLSVTVAPRQIATVDVGLVSEADVRAHLRVAKAQVMCAVAEIRYADGAVWEMKGHTIFGPDHAEIPRSQIGAAPTAGAPLCRDTSGGWFSEGGVVPISGEWGFVKCENGTWREYDLPPMSPIAARP